MREYKPVPTQQKQELGIVMGPGCKDLDAEAQQQQSYATEGGLKNPLDPKEYELTKTKKNKKKKIDPLKVLENDFKRNLNKLNPDNFDKIKVKILELTRTSKDNMDIIVRKIIEKAWVELKYMETYAQLCNFLIVSEGQSGMTSMSESSKKKNNSFKSKLLEKIQKVFETEEVTDHQKAKGLKKKM